MAKCPHCQNEIDVISPNEAAKMLGMSIAGFNLMRKLPEFPEPWMEPKGRTLWLTSEIQNARQGQSRARLDRAVDKLVQQLPEMDSATLEETVKSISETLMDRVKSTKNGNNKKEKVTA